MGDRRELSAPAIPTMIGAPIRPRDRWIAAIGAFGFAFVIGRGFLFQTAGPAARTALVIAWVLIGIGWIARQISSGTGREGPGGREAFKTPSAPNKADQWLRGATAAVFLAGAAVAATLIEPGARPRAFFPVIGFPLAALMTVRLIVKKAPTE